MRADTFAISWQSEFERKRRFIQSGHAQAATKLVAK
jgi:hypothetical protein